MRRFLVPALTLTAILASSLAFALNTGSGMTADQALDALKQGNARFVSGAVARPDQGKFRREETAKNGQKPFVTVLSCSDSRVPVELLFDRGVGDIFSVRIAGNVAEDGGIGTVEYGVDHLGTPLLVVLGHTKCGAVTATVQKADVHGKLPVLVEKIQPAVEKTAAAKPNLSGGDFVQAAIEANVWQAVGDIMAASPMLAEKVKAGQLKVMGAMYDIASGQVSWLGQWPAKQ